MAQTASSLAGGAYRNMRNKFLVRMHAETTDGQKGENDKGVSITRGEVAKITWGEGSTSLPLIEYCEVSEGGPLHWSGRGRKNDPMFPNHPHIRTVPKTGHLYVAPRRTTTYTIRCQFQDHAKCEPNNPNVFPNGPTCGMNSKSVTVHVKQP